MTKMRTGDRSGTEAGVDRLGQSVKAAIASTLDFLGDDGKGAAPLLPVLHTMQAEFGFIDPELIPEIASALNISKAEVRGVISFYHDYRSAQAGKRTLRLCRAEACQAMGCERLSSYLASKHGLKPGDTTPDGTLTIENVYCLGNCALAPAALLGHELIGRFDETQIDALVLGTHS